MEQQAMQEMTLEEWCGHIRGEIKILGNEVAAMHTSSFFAEGDNSLDPGNVPPTRNANAHANITLAFRHLEDARMRLGKVMQAIQGGTSILDTEESPSDT